MFTILCQLGDALGLGSKHQIVILLKMHWITRSSRFSWLYKSWIMSGQNHQRKNSSRQKCWNSCCQGKTCKTRSSSKVDFSKIHFFGKSQSFENSDLRRSISRKFRFSEKVDLPKIKIFGKSRSLEKNVRFENNYFFSSRLKQIPNISRLFQLTEN